MICIFENVFSGKEDVSQSEVSKLVASKSETNILVFPHVIFVLLGFFGLGILQLLRVRRIFKKK